MANAPLQRRSEDRELQVVVVPSGIDAAEPLQQLRTVRGDLDGKVLGEPVSIDLSHLPEPDRAAYVLELGTETVVLVPAHAQRLSAADSDSVQRALQAAAAWRRQQARVQRRLLLPDRLITFAEELNRAQNAAAVYQVLMTHIPRVVGGYACVVLLKPEWDAAESSYRAVEHVSLATGAHEYTVPATAAVSGPTLITAEDVALGSGTFEALAPLYFQEEVKAGALVPFGDAGVFLLLERRSDRAFETDEWDLMRSLARQVGIAIERIRLFERVRELSLTDPLTGLGNRRRLDIVLEHSFAAARRGDPLTLVMIDLDNFKEINDSEGHMRGDQILRIVARTLQENLRGSDMVVRYGGDEFLLVLTSGVDGARAFVDRVRDQLRDVIGFSVGIASYDPKMLSIEHLIMDADRNLYLHKTALR